MKIQFTDNGEILEVKDFQNIVEYMRNCATHLDSETNQEYMLGYAQRAVISNDEDIRATSEKEFIEDLIDKGHIRILET